jgi:hypothetical protein
MSDKRSLSSLSSTTREQKEQDQGISDLDIERPLPQLPTRDLEKAENPTDATDPFEVCWAEDDAEDPYNWSTGKKAWCTFQLGMLALAGSAGSAIMAPGETAISAEFGIPHQVTILATSLYVTGFILGPSIWAPISELYGRRFVFFLEVF